jgi:hypothetical protein
LSHSPYTITLSKNWVYEFVTDSDHTYQVYFDNSTNIFPDERVDDYAVYFGFNCNPPLVVLSRTYDPRIGATVMHIIANFFVANPNSILAYVCSALDQQGRHRQILFTKWYTASPLKRKFEFIQKKFYDTYCGVIYHAEHPELEMIREAFVDFDLENKFEVQEEAEVYVFEDEEE